MNNYQNFVEESGYRVHFDQNLTQYLQDID